MSDDLGPPVLVDYTTATSGGASVYELPVPPLSNPNCNYEVIAAAAAPSGNVYGWNQQVWPSRFAFHSFGAVSYSYPAGIMLERIFQDPLQPAVVKLSEASNSPARPVAAVRLGFVMPDHRNYYTFLTSSGSTSGIGQSFGTAVQWSELYLPNTLAGKHEEGLQLTASASNFTSTSRSMGPSTLPAQVYSEISGSIGIAVHVLQDTYTSVSVYPNKQSTSFGAGYHQIGGLAHIYTPAPFPLNIPGVDSEVMPSHLTPSDPVISVRPTSSKPRRIMVTGPTVAASGPAPHRIPSVEEPLHEQEYGP